MPTPSVESCETVTDGHSMLPRSGGIVSSPEQIEAAMGYLERGHQFVSDSACMKSPFSLLSRLLYAWEQFRLVKSTGADAVQMQRFDQIVKDKIETGYAGLLAGIDSEYQQKLNRAKSRDRQKEHALRAREDLLQIVELANDFPPLRQAALLLCDAWQDQLTLFEQPAVPMPPPLPIRKTECAWEVRLPDGRVQGFRLRRDAIQFASEYPTASPEQRKTLMGG